MNKYIIKICYPSNHKLGPIEIEETINTIKNAIKEQFDSDSTIYTTYPTIEDIEANRCTYIFTVHLWYCLDLYSSEVFACLSDALDISVVNVVDARYVNAGDKTGWYNEGTTSYSNSSMHVDCKYVWCFNGEKTDYDVIDVEQYCKKLPEERKIKYDNMKYMWSFITTWDNPLKADNLEDALKEFEQWYYEMLWNTITNLQEKLNKATDNFRLMAEYKDFKMCNRRS